MDRCGTFTFNGVEYPTLASARAIDTICKKYGLTLETVFENFNGEDFSQTLFYLSSFLEAGNRWAVRNGAEAKVPPSHDDLMDELPLAELRFATIIVMETLAKGMGLIKAEPKNANPPKDEAEL